MQFTTVRSQEKYYDIYLKSEKLVHSQQEYEKSVSQLFGGKTKLVPSSFEPNKHCCSYLEREKRGSLLFGEQKMQFTTVRSKEKDYDIYLKSEKLVHSQQEHEKNVSQLFRSGKNWFLAFRALQTLLQLFGERKNWIPAIWRPKNVVHKCQVQGKRL